MTLATIDIVVIVAYAIFIFGLAHYVSREKAGHQKDSSDYFLASKNLPWWAIGASLIAANISAEQIIGMSGSGYAIGLAIASYEWMAAITLLLVGKFFLPIFLKNDIVTMPQFLEQRYGTRIRTLMAVFWLALYVFVNLTSIVWLGSIAVNKVAGVDQDVALFALGGFALVYQLYGGLKAVAMTDIVQVTLLVFGGLLISGITREPTAFQGDSLLLPSVAVVVLAGTSRLGGRGFPISTVIAAFFLNQLSQFALAVGVPFSAQTIIQALALVFGIGVYSVRWRRSARTRSN